MCYLLEIERNKIKDQMTSGPPEIGSASEVELSEESDGEDNYLETRKPKMNNKKGWHVGKNRLQKHTSNIHFT